MNKKQVIRILIWIVVTAIFLDIVIPMINGLNPVTPILAAIFVFVYSFVSYYSKCFTDFTELKRKKKLDK